MRMVTLSTPIARARRDHKESPLGLYIAVIKDLPNAGEVQHKRAFKRMVLSDGYEDFVEAIIQEWQSIKYSTALRAAQPPGISEIKAAAAKRKARREEETSLVKTAKQVLGVRLLEMVAPNGKHLGDCTGKECLLFGGFYEAIGHKVGADQTVRDAMTAKELAAIARKERIGA